MKTTIKLSLAPLLLTLIFLVSGVHQTHAQVVTTDPNQIIGYMVSDEYTDSHGDVFEGTRIPIFNEYGIDQYQIGASSDYSYQVDDSGNVHETWTQSHRSFSLSCYRNYYYNPNNGQYPYNFKTNCEALSDLDQFYLTGEDQDYTGYDYFEDNGFSLITLTSHNNLGIQCGVPNQWNGYQYGSYTFILTGPGVWTPKDVPADCVGSLASSPGAPVFRYGTVTVTQVVTPPLNLTATSTGNIGQYSTKLEWTPATSTDETAQFLEIATSSNPFEIVAKLSRFHDTYIDDNLDNELSSQPISYRIMSHYPNVQTDGSTEDNLQDPEVYSNNAYSEIATSSPPCLHISGKGPYSIVFVIGKQLLNYDKKINPIDEMGYVNDIIDNGFKSVDPFKKYIDKFSFYIDNRNVDEQSLLGVNGSFTDTMGKKIADESSCRFTGQTEYVYLFGDPDFSGAWTVFNTPTIFINVYNFEEAFVTGQFGVLKLTNVPNATFDGVLANTAIHESGHHVGLLYDEYAVGSANPFDYSDLTTISGYVQQNCAADPHKEYSYNGYIYGSTDLVGCHFLFAGINLKHGYLYHRPSSNSLMNNSFVENKFNVISCGYVMSGILGETIDFDHAKTHWPECENMDTIKDGYMKMTQSPNINDIQIDRNTTGGNTYIVNGSGFSSTGNSISLSPSGSASAGPSSLAPSNNTNLLASIGGAYKAVTGIIQSIINIILPSNSAPVGKDYQSTTTANPTPTLDTTTTTVSTTTTDGGHYEIDDIPSDNADGTSITFTVPTTTPDGVYTVGAAAEASDWTYTPFTITVTGNGAGDPTTEIGPDTSDTATSTSTSTPPVTPPTTASTTYTLIETTPVNKVLYTGTDKTFQLTGLSPNSSYCAILVATYPSGTTATSSEVCVNTQPSPSSPIPAVSTPPVFNVSNPGTVSVPSVGQDYVNPVDVGGHSR